MAHYQFFFGSGDSSAKLTDPLVENSRIFKVKLFVLKSSEYSNFFRISIPQKVIALRQKCAPTHKLLPYPSISLDKFRWQRYTQRYLLHKEYRCGKFKCNLW